MPQQDKQIHVVGRLSCYKICSHATTKRTSFRIYYHRTPFQHTAIGLKLHCCAINIAKSCSRPSTLSCLENALSFRSSRSSAKDVGKNKQNVLRTLFFRNKLSQPPEFHTKDAQSAVWTPPSKEAFFFFFFLGFSFVGFSVISSSTVTVWGAAEEVFFSSVNLTFFNGLFAPSSLTRFFAPLFLRMIADSDADAF